MEDEVKNEMEQDEGKEDESEREEDAAEDREESFEYFDTYDKYEAALMEIRNAGPDDNIDASLERMRKQYSYYEAKLNQYDADYDSLMARYEKVMEDNKRYMLHESVAAETSAVQEQQKDDIIEDGRPKTFDDLWKNREG